MLPPMKYGLFIHGLAIPKRSEHDGRWVSSYDPTKNGVHGEIYSTADPAHALKFDSQEAALKAWRAEHGLRPDGRPNRPLTAFTVSVEPLPE